MNDTLDRFLAAQDRHCAQALDELRAGRKTSHWIWFVLPQLRGLGRSSTAYEYGITGHAEAQAYLAHPVLGERLRECVQTMLTHKNKPAERILGEVDAMKFRSCLTLFEAVSGEPGGLFTQALQRFYGGERDEATLSLLASSP